MGPNWLGLGLGLGLGVLERVGLGLREDEAHRARKDGERQVDEVEGCQRAVLHLGRGGTARERTTTWR